jgi:hypothetical protein
MNDPTYNGPFIGTPLRRPDLNSAEREELRCIKMLAAVGRCTQAQLARWGELEPFQVHGMAGGLAADAPAHLYLRFRPSVHSLVEFASGCACPTRWAVGEWETAQAQADWLSCLYRTSLRYQRAP